MGFSMRYLVLFCYKLITYSHNVVTYYDCPCVRGVYAYDFVVSCFSLFIPSEE